MKQKKEFVLREVCGESFIMQQGSSSIDFGRLLGLSESAVWLWKQAGEQDLRDFTRAYVKGAQVVAIPPKNSNKVQKSYKGSGALPIFFVSLQSVTDI